MIRRKLQNENRARIEEDMNDTSEGQIYDYDRKDEKRIPSTQQMRTKVVPIDREKQDEDFLYSEFFILLRNERDINNQMVDC